MPVTKTAKRALRVANKKASFNKVIVTRLEKAVKAAKKGGSKEKILAAMSLLDKAAGKHAIHQNKANRIKSALGKLLPKANSTSKKGAKKTSKKSPHKK